MFAVERGGNSGAFVWVSFFIFHRTKTWMFTVLLLFSFSIFCWCSVCFLKNLWNLRRILHIQFALNLLGYPDWLMYLFLPTPHCSNRDMARLWNGNSMINKQLSINLLHAAAKVSKSKGVFVVAQISWVVVMIFMYSTVTTLMAFMRQ